MLLLKSINNTTPSGMDARRFKRLTLKLYEESGVPIEPCGQNEIKQFEEVLDVQVHISAEHFNKCQMKHSAPKKDIVEKPMISSELRSQVDLIDLQSNSDGEYKFIMVYQDHLTKFVQLRPLKTKRAEEVAYRVLPIFLTFGAPAILQSDNGREFSNQVISEICAMWKDVKIVRGKPRHSQTQGSVERANQDIQNMLTAWMNDNNTNKWSEGLPFVQFAKNTTYHEGIRQSPYEVMFGIKAKRGIASSFLPSEQIASIETEEQLQETGNTSEKNLSGGQTENQIPKKNIEEDVKTW
ncbi:KRAB-A domain-containing protein 2-like [Argiope bruennichi]|uniref:KRAB-A domain-containing protein 2-like n=1 Tax=Argiope bruennichi TaxID=94029 RepID=UPI002494DB50|nr:KRAB-A domain-containing protein 2-like [Argiope bruennichi]